MNQIFTDSWNFLRNNYYVVGGFLLSFGVITHAIEYALTQYSQTTLIDTAEPLPGATTAPDEVSGLVFVVLLVSLLFAAIYQCALILLFLSINKDKKISYLECVLSSLSFIPYFVVLSLIVNLGVLAGLIFLVIPGVYLYARLCLYDFELIVNRKAPYEAMIGTWEKTKDNVVLILSTLVPMLLLTLALVFIYAAMDISNFVATLLVNLVLMFVSSFLVLLRYRLFTLLGTNSAQK